jgi:hypothetical protein
MGQEAPESSDEEKVPLPPSPLIPGSPHFSRPVGPGWDPGGGRAAPLGVKRLERDGDKEAQEGVLACKQAREERPYKRGGGKSELGGLPPHT